MLNEMLECLAKMMQIKIKVQSSQLQCKLQDDNNNSTRNHEPANVGASCYVTLSFDATFIFALWHNY